jgi:hypothetical protein
LHKNSRKKRKGEAILNKPQVKNTKQTRKIKSRAKNHYRLTKKFISGTVAAIFPQKIFFASKQRVFSLQKN